MHATRGPSPIFCLDKQNLPFHIHIHHYNHRYIFRSVLSSPLVTSNYIQHHEIMADKKKEVVGEFIAIPELIYVTWWDVTTPLSE